MTPYGAAVKMLRMHKGREVADTSSGLDPNGNGLGALATLDQTGLVVDPWYLCLHTRGSPILLRIESGSRALVRAMS